MTLVAPDAKLLAAYLLEDNLRKLLSVLCVLAAFTFCANAAVITLTFEGLQDGESVNDFYNGGTGSLGSAGPNYGISFTSDSLAIISQAAGGGGNFDGAPTMPTILYFLTGAGDTMNVAAGFDTGFSFYYSSPFYTGSVLVYDGLGGTGTLLATLTLPLTPSGGAGCSGTYAYCPWEPFGVAFSGVAKSAVFSGVANYIGFDNVTLGSGIPTGGVPEPATLAITGLGIVALALVRRRRE